MDRIALVTDFGTAGPYTGQIRCLFSALMPSIPVVELISDLTPFRPDLASYLLPALTRALPEGTLYLCVVDPGVGGDRAVVGVKVGRDLYLGPDNGLLAGVSRSPGASVMRLRWRPDWMSDSFHGRDVFVPLAVRCLRADDVGYEPIGKYDLVGAGSPAETNEILYADRYGNLITGLDAGKLSRSTKIRSSATELEYARTFCAVPRGTPFWYENAFGLVELSVSQGRADEWLGLGPGDSVSLVP